MKGAPERIFQRCNRIIANGIIQRIDESWVVRFNETYATLGGNGEQVFGN